MKSVITSGETLYYAKRLIYMRNPDFTIQKGNRFYQKNGAAYLKPIKMGSNKGINRVCDIMSTLYKGWVSCRYLRY